eukprot:1522398-Amphidinium_carterae.1
MSVVVKARDGDVTQPLESHKALVRTTLEQSSTDQKPKEHLLFQSYEVPMETLSGEEYRGNCYTRSFPPNLCKNQQKQTR